MQIELKRYTSNIFNFRKTYQQIAHGHVGTGTSGRSFKLFKGP